MCTCKHRAVCHGAVSINWIPLLCAAVQNRLTAGLCRCNYTYEDLLFIQMSSDPTPMHCNTVQGKMQSALLSKLCNCPTLMHSWFVQDNAHISSGLQKQVLCMLPHAGVLIQHFIPDDQHLPSTDLAFVGGLTAA